MPRSVIVIAVLLFYALHQDFWFWHEARPLVFGVMPIGLFYHAVYTLAVSLLVWGLIRVAWPSRLEAAEEGDRASSESRSGSE